MAYPILKPKEHFLKKYQSKYQSDESFGSCLKKETNWIIVIPRGIVNGLGKNSLEKITALKLKIFFGKNSKKFDLIFLKIFIFFFVSNLCLLCNNFIDHLGFAELQKRF